MSSAETDLYVRSLLEMLGAVGRRLDGLTPSDLNYRSPLPDANTLYAIATHVFGNTEAWVLGIVCGLPAVRDRNAEFRAAGDDVGALIERGRSLSEAIGKALGALPSGLMDERRKPRPPLLGIGPGDELSVREALMRVLLHGRQHVGHMELTRDLAVAAREVGST